MKKIIISGLSAMLMLAAFQKQAISQNPQPHPKPRVSHHNDWHINDNGHLPGTWDAVIKDGEVNIQFYGEHWSNGRNFTAAELGTLPTDKVGEFSLNRESGKLNFKGVFQDHWGHGTYQFDESPAFKAYLAQKGYKGLDNELMLNIFFTDISKGYFDYLRANGYTSISNNQLKDLAQENLTRKALEDYFNLFKTEGYGHQSIDKIVELRQHGVDARFVSSFHQAGFKNIPLDKALDLRDHGVNVEFITSIQKMGYEKITLDRAQELRDHGVNPEFIAEMQSIGYKNISLEKAQELRDHGVNPEFIKSISDLGFKDISLDQAQELRDHGVNAAFIKKAQTKGMNLHTLDDYIKLRDTGFND